jgi:hypothetical protein
MKAKLLTPKLVTLGIALALASTSAFAGQPFGRDSVYAAPGSTHSGTKVAAAKAGNGRGSVYASDLPAPTPKDKVRIAVVSKLGRA